MKLYEPAPPARKDELANVQDGIAVIVDGDTCPVVVESGMYAYIKNNTHGLAEGLYKNTSDSAFPTSGGTADGTVFEADSTGGLNALNASIISSCTGIANKSHFGSINGTVRVGNVVQVSAVVIVDANISGNDDIISLPYEAAYNNLYVYGWKDGSNDFHMFNIYGNQLKCPEFIAAGSALRLGFTYICKP